MTSQPSTFPSETHRTVALAGNPNCGKTTLFNLLTGLRQKVGNYPGVTVEKKEGRMRVGDTDVTVIDIPGTYSLSARSLDEQVARGVLLGLQPGTTRPDLIVAIVDASNLERNLYLTSQMMELGRPVVVALNMMDLAAQNGIDIDAGALSRELGVPVVPIVAAKGIGLDALRRAIAGTVPPLPERRWTLPAPVEAEVTTLLDFVRAESTLDTASASGETIRLLLNDVPDSEGLPGDAVMPTRALSEALGVKIAAARERLEAADIDWWSVEPEGRYRWIKEVCERAVFKEAGFKQTASDRIDKVLTHRLFGPLSFAVLMFFVFQSIFTWAQWPMDAIAVLVGKASDWVRSIVPPGDLQGLLADGVVPGVGGVITFLPQILILSFFISLLEDTGYMARAAFIMDRIMRRVGLSGKSFIPLLSSFACAIPGITAARTVENPKDRLVTILIAPLMSCSARIPVYGLMIGAFFPPSLTFGGYFRVGGVVLFSMYLLGIVVAIGMAWLFKKTLLRGASPPLIMELPPYRFPSWRNVLASMLDRGGQFVQRAGTIILAISMVLWFLATYPKNVPLGRDYDGARAQLKAETVAGKLSDDDLAARTKELDDAEKAERREQSYIGRTGRFIEPVLRPLGFNWKIGIGILSAFAAREVLVGTLAIIYGVGDDADEGSASLHRALQADRHSDGRPVYSPLVAISLMVFFVLALQCMSTFATVRRETNSWRWPLFMLAYMTTLAYGASLVVYQGGRLLGLG